MVGTCMRGRGGYCIEEVIDEVIEEVIEEVIRLQCYFNTWHVMWCTCN